MQNRKNKLQNKLYFKNWKLKSKKEEKSNKSFKTWKDNFIKKKWKLKLEERIVNKLKRNKGKNIKSNKLKFKPRRGKDYRKFRKANYNNNSEKPCCKSSLMMINFSNLPNKNVGLRNNSTNERSKDYGNKSFQLSEYNNKSRNKKEREWYKNNTGNRILFVSKNRELFDKIFHFFKDLLQSN